MKKHIFYSWQSDLDKKTNRNFLGDCIEKAIKELNKSGEYEIEFSIDRDTLDEIGTPHITNSIFQKIEKALLFIADVSIINSESPKRKTANPNVLIELGYAAKVLGWNRIILLFNTDTGRVEDLPFDIRFRRILSYSLKDNDGNFLDIDEKGKVKRNLAKIIMDNIQTLDFSNVINETDVGTYLICESSVFYNKFVAEFTNTLNENGLKTKYNYTSSDFNVDMWDNFEERYEKGESCSETDIAHCIWIAFIDDVFTHEGIDRECSISFQFLEKFKQINFSNKKVYSVFEVISRGYSPSSIKGRNYDELSNELLRKIESME